MPSKHRHDDLYTSHALTNRGLFRPQHTTGNPSYDFFTHYSRLSPLDRLTFERHTVNGEQISRYEPDISHSTCAINRPSFIETLRERARELTQAAALALALTSSANAFSPSVGDFVRSLDADALAEAQVLLETRATAPEFIPAANSFAARFGLRHELGAASSVDHSLEVKIAAPEYAARKLGNGEDAAEFVRCLRLIAGGDASALYLQQLASHYYAEAKRRPTAEVLKEMGLLAMEMSAVTATVEQLEFANDDGGEVHLASYLESPHEDESASPSLSERRAISMERAAQVLGERTTESIFADELRGQVRLVYRKQAQAFDYDEFDIHLSDMSAGTEDDEEFGAYFDSFERAYEQFDEGFAVSLHMTDSDRKIACGDLDDVVDGEALPECALHLADKLHRLYTSGFPLYDKGEGDDCEGIIVNTIVRDVETGARVFVPTFVYGIDSWMDAALDDVFSERIKRLSRRYVWLTDTKRSPRETVRERIVPRVVEVEETRRGGKIHRREVRHFIEREAVTVPRSRLHEQTETIEVCPNAEERAQARAVLEILLHHLKRDYHTRGLHTCASYRQLTARLNEARDTAIVAAIKREAWQEKEAGRLSFKLFTALNAHAAALQAKLEAAPLTELRAHRIITGDGFTMTQSFTDGARKFIVAQPLLNSIPQLTGKTISDFAGALHELPRQERERVRRAFGERNPRLYARVRDGLKAEISRASQAKLRYFRWVFYTGNKPEHPVHILTREDQAAAWELLKTRANISIKPSVPFVETDAVNAAIAAAV